MNYKRNFTRKGNGSRRLFYIISIWLFPHTIKNAFDEIFMPISQREIVYNECLNVESIDEELIRIT